MGGEVSLTASQLRRFLELIDHAVHDLGDAVSPDERAMFADLRVRQWDHGARQDLVVLGLRALGGRAAESGHSELVAELYGAVLEVVPDEFSLWYDMGNHLSRLDRKDEAISAYDQALRLKPGFAWAHYNRGRLQYERGRYPEAVADFIEAAKHDCDVEGFARSITDRIIPVAGFAAMVDIITGVPLPDTQRQNLVEALRRAIDSAAGIDGWYLRLPPGPPRDATYGRALILHAMLADIRRDSPVTQDLPFFARTQGGYEGQMLDEARLRETHWYLPPEGAPQTANRVDHLERLAEMLELDWSADVLEAIWAVHYVTGAIALSFLMNGALDWPTPVLRLSIDGHMLDSGGLELDQPGCAAVAGWISERESCTPAEFSLRHFRAAADALTALVLSHVEPVTYTTFYFGDDGEPLVSRDGGPVTRPGSVDLAESEWWFAEPVYREWVLAAGYGHTPGDRLTALCHARRFNALAATELWSAAPVEKWRRCRELIMSAYDPDVTLPTVRSALGPDATLVDYYTYEIFGENVSQLTVTSADSRVTTREVDVMGGELRAMLQAGNPSEFPAAGFAPLADAPLAYPSPMPRTLVIVPYGYIRKIPVHALPAVLHAVDAGELDRVVYLPTAAYAGRARRPPATTPRTLFVGYDPTGDIDLDRDLEFLRGYADQVTVLIHDEATLANVLAELPHHQLVHFACHGDMDTNIAAGYLELAGARLYPWNILGTTVPETVVLNACLGVSADRIETSSDAAFGLHDAFLAVGARNVVGGLWEVNEWTARAFSEAFYRRLPAGPDVASAVLSAQRDLRAATLDPFLWAPHACFGEWRT